MDYNRKEIEQLLEIASYHDEIARRKLAAQMVLTLGPECSKEKILHILAGKYQGATIRTEQLARENVEGNSFYVMQTGGRIFVVVSHLDGERAEVYADYGAADGILAIGKETSQTMDGTVYELEVAGAEEIQIIVYTYPVEYETERIIETKFN